MLPESGVVNPINDSNIVVLPTPVAVSYTHLRAHETVLEIVCRLLHEKKKKNKNKKK